MGLFSFFKKESAEDLTARQNADLELLSPVSGTLVPLKEVPDIVISEKVIGDGVAVSPVSSTVVAPCSGVVTRFIASSNAFAIRHESGVEIYVTCGIGANGFTGQGFKALCALGDSVSAGQSMIEMDLNVVNDTLESSVVSLIVINSSADISRVLSASGKVEGGSSGCVWVMLGKK